LRSFFYGVRYGAYFVGDLLGHLVDSFLGLGVMRKLFISFLLLFVAEAASAEVVWYHYNFPSDTFSSSPSASCALGIAKMSGNTSTGASQAANGNYDCNCSWKAYPGAPDTFGTCGQATSTTKPDCPSGQVRQPNGGCAAPPPPPCSTPSGQPVSWNQKTGHSASPDAAQGDGAPGPYPTSSPSCGVSGTPKVEDCWSTPASDGGQDFFCKFSGTSNGQQAPAGTPSDAGSKPAGAAGTNMPPTKAGPDGSCPGGSTQGGVDSGGTPICVGSGTNPTGSNGGAPTDARPTASTTTKTTDASGNKVTTTTGTRDNGDGSKTVTKTVETEAPDGSKSSSTTTTTGLTPGGKQGQPDKPDDDFCRVHPELNMCRNSSIAGQCGQITCMGDAIQCATLREAATIQCRQKEAEDAIKASPQFTLGNAAANGNDPEKGSLPAPGNGTTVDVSALSADGWLGGGAPIDDVSVEFQGQSIVIPFSKAASALIVLRYALMVAASLISFRILSGAVLGS
jgi:hypothetical protein